MFTAIGVLAYVGAWGVLVTGIFHDVPLWLAALCGTIAVTGVLLAWGRNEDEKARRKRGTDRRNRAFDMFH